MPSQNIKITYPSLPVSSAKDEIFAALSKSQVVVVVGDTGSGKTTQLPKMALEFANDQGFSGVVGCTQPRRIAAASVSKRVSEELGVELGKEVGYQVRFTDKSSSDTKIKFMTDGILLAETQGDADLKNYHTIIIDEAHERSLNIDFLIGYLKRLVEIRSDLKVIISSATLDAGGFADFFGEAPVVNVEGRTFPVETQYLPIRDDEDMARHVARSVEEIRRISHQGDVLIFLPGEREIRECADVLEGRQWAGTEILPLFARLGMADQQRVFTTRAGVQRIVLATNVAETSLTIPGIVYVVDTGVARMSRWNPSRQVQRLQIEKISQASANQRKGRCGRVSEGTCIRLYEEDCFEERSEFTDPEIRRSSLAGVILRMKSLHLPEIEDFPFLDPPSSKHVAEGYKTLREIGALNDVHEITNQGKKLARIPVEPRLARMLLDSIRMRCYSEMLVIVSGLSVMDPKERPAEKQKEADDAHKQWNDEESDFVSILHIWNALHPFREKRGWQRNQLRKFCKRNFLNFRRVLEWDNLHKELAKLGKDVFKWQVRDWSDSPQSWASHESIHKVLLVGMPRQVGKLDRKTKSYKGGAGREFAIFPGSGLFGQKKPEWLLAYDMVDTTRLWARRVAKIDPKWVEDVVPHLCRSRYHSARWDQKQGVVYAKEIVVCGGLTLIDGRNVHYGKIDPVAARNVFIREGLLGGGLKGKPTCLKVLNKLKGQVKEMEHKLRRVDGIWSEECVLEFFEKRVPADMCTAKAFFKWESENKDGVIPALENVMYDDVESLKLSDYPSSVSDGYGEYSVYYNAAHGEVDDGVTLGVHVDQLADFQDWLLEWGVRGTLEERVYLLIRSLPKGQRVACNPAVDTAADFVRGLSGKNDGYLYAQLAGYLSQRTGLNIEAKMFDVSKLPAEMITKIWVCDDDGNELAMGADLSAIRKKLAAMMEERFEEASGEDWEQHGMKSWECEALPISIDVGRAKAFPALIDEGDTVGVKVYSRQNEAEKNHLAGCVRLFLLDHSDQAKYVSKNLPLSLETKMYLPHLGAKGVNQGQVLRCAVEGVFSGSVPRDAESLSEASSRGRGEMFDYAEQLGNWLDELIAAYRVVEDFIQKHKDHQHLSEVAQDLQAQVNWLLRENFMAEAGWKLMPSYVLYFKGMLERVKQLNALPLIRDLEKMDKVHEYQDAWYDRWQGDRENLDLIECGYLLEQFRLLQFSPSLVVKGSVSEKKVRVALEGLGLV